MKMVCLPHIWSILIGTTIVTIKFGDTMILDKHMYSVYTCVYMIYTPWEPNKMNWGNRMGPKPSPKVGEHN